MFNRVVSGAALAVSLLPWAGPANAHDVVLITDNFYDVVLGSGSELDVPTGETGGPLQVGPMSINGKAFDIFLTEPGSNVISDHIFAPGGDSQFGTSDYVWFASTGMNDPFLGTLCDPAKQTCVPETGLLQDLTQYVPDCSVNRACTLQVLSVDAPEPATLGVFGAGLAGLFAARRRRAARNDAGA